MSLSFNPRRVTKINISNMSMSNVLILERKKAPHSFTIFLFLLIKTNFRFEKYAKVTEQTHEIKLAICN